MKRKNLLTVLALVLLLGAGLLWAFEKVSSTNKENHQTAGKENTTPSELLDAEGQVVNFKEFQGKIVFINNWASWCRPCIVEMPTIEHLKEEFSVEDVSFVMVSYDKDPQKSLDWMEKNDLDLPVYFPGKDFPQEFITEVIPTTFILGREGGILHKQVGMADYSSEGFIAQMKEWINQ